LNFLTALLVDRHKRGRLRHRGAQCLDLEQNKNNLLNYGFDEDDINQAIEKVKNRNSERGIK